MPKPQEPTFGLELPTPKSDTSHIMEYQVMRMSVDSPHEQNQMRNSMSRMSCDIACKQVADDLINSIIEDHVNDFDLVLELRVK